VSGTVLVDTNIFPAPLRDDRPLQAQYRKHTFGRRIAVAPQTVAEARYGALIGGWGARRLNELARLTAGVRVVPVDDETIEHAARLRNQCRVIGHGLHQRPHNADLWIAAAAIRWTIPCRSRRRVHRPPCYRPADGTRPLTRQWMGLPTLRVVASRTEPRQCGLRGETEMRACGELRDGEPVPQPALL
jgi:predicted nucleic acid-binding protein